MFVYRGVTLSDRAWLLGWLRALTDDCSMTHNASGNPTPRINTSHPGIYQGYEHIVWWWRILSSPCISLGPFKFVFLRTSLRYLCKTLDMNRYPKIWKDIFWVYLPWDILSTVCPWPIPCPKFDSKPLLFYKMQPAIQTAAIISANKPELCTRVHQV